MFSRTKVLSGKNMPSFSDFFTRAVPDSKDLPKRTFYLTDGSQHKLHTDGSPITEFSMERLGDFPVLGKRFLWK